MPAPSKRIEIVTIISVYGSPSPQKSLAERSFLGFLGFGIIRSKIENATRIVYNAISDFGGGHSLDSAPLVKSGPPRNNIPGATSRPPSFACPRQARRATGRQALHVR